MLIELRFENHRSARDEQVLTLEAGRVGTVNDGRVREADNLRLLPVAAIYGANASGKSNVLSAIGFMRDAVLDSHSSWPPLGGVPREAFAWAGKANEPSTFEVTVLIGGIRYQYGFSVDQERVLEEWLFAWPRGRKQTWFERARAEFAFGEHLRGENRVLEKVTRPNALFLSTAARHQHEQLTPVFDWFNKLLTVRVVGYKERYSDAMPASVAAAVFAAAAAAAAARGPSGMIRVSDLVPTRQSTEFSEALPRIDPPESTNLRDLLRAADVGIADFRVSNPRGNKSGADQRRIELRHDVGEDDAWLPLEQESAGTRALFRLGPAVIRALASGTPLVVDELESSLHPLIALEVVRLFNDPDANPHDAQLLFTTHDTNLLGTILGAQPLRRDQIWLTEKDPKGGTNLYPLTDFKPRKLENLERGYLQGRYGAIPILGALARLAGEE
ncbi:MAG: ATP-binding protein [Deltaproteobacteria bacterium]|nr:ATP-binding protein [Deltaproteobacteria bacterium]